MKTELEVAAEALFVFFALSVSLAFCFSVAFSLSLFGFLRTSIAKESL
jgi:hypothetical protein